jgi:hypothetical protein
MKYLIRQVEIGDAIGVWRVLYDKFRHVTPHTIKRSKTEWNALSMDAHSLFVDEFVALVIKKSTHLKSMGVDISNHDEAVTLLEGLSANFGWMKLHFRLPSHQGYTFEEVSKIAVDYTSDKQRTSKEVCSHFSSHSHF